MAVKEIGKTEDTKMSWHHETMNMSGRTSYAYIWFSTKHLAYLLEKSNTNGKGAKSSLKRQEEMLVDSSFEAPSTCDGSDIESSSGGSEMSWKVSNLELDDTEYYTHRTTIHRTSYFEVETPDSSFEIVKLTNSRASSKNSSFEFISTTNSLLDLRDEKICDQKDDSSLELVTSDSESEMQKSPLIDKTKIDRYNYLIDKT